MIRRGLAAVALLYAALPATAGVPDPSYRDLTQAFASFADRTAGLPDADRATRFIAEVAPLFPDFYKPQDGETPEKYSSRLLVALKDFPAIRARYLAAQAAFPATYAAGLAHMRQAFADFRAPDETVFLHSLGELDGGTRRFHKRNVMLFGADGIARYHDLEALGPFFDHELFHVEHARVFADCEAVWCGLWQEGLATYVAARLNPGIDDRLLMLETPQPIRATVDAHWREALCLLAAKKEATTRADYGLFFFGNANGTIFPPRFGYYLGLRLAERAGTTTSLDALAHLRQPDAKALVDTTIADMVRDAGGCAAPTL
jgi:hypothetical protein